MKHILLSIFMMFAIGVYVPSSTKSVPVQQINSDETVYEAALIDLNPPSDSVNAIAPGLLTPKLDKPKLYLKNYFNGLTENFGENAKGSCTYVALGMMLSYYDSYLCDDIIPEQYDVASIGNGTDIIGRNNSPGTVNDKILNNVSDQDYQTYIDSLTKIAYYNILKEKFGSNSLQVKLIELADSENISKIDNGNDSFGSSFYRSFLVLEKYIDSLGFKRGADYDLPFTQDEDVNVVKQFIIDNIDLGRPVFVCGQGIMGSHAFVCYDYDNIDSISAHWGWHDSGYINQDPFLFFGDKIEALAIDFKIEHTHSYNYMVGSKAYCYCDTEIETYHNHTYTYKSIDSQNHRLTCACGKTGISAHWVKGAPSGRYANCAACGALLDLYSGPYIGIYSLSKTANGSYIHTSGIPVIMEADVEAYLNGTLKFGTGISNYDNI